jgi:hypothetical protein
MQWFVRVKTSFLFVVLFPSLSPLSFRGFPFFPATCYCVTVRSIPSFCFHLVRVIDFQLSMYRFSCSIDLFTTLAMIRRFRDDNTR